MPKHFTFTIDNEHVFRCPLKSFQCREDTADGYRCQNSTVIGTHYCWRHLQKNHHLRILPSKVPEVRREGGKGLFALSTQHKDNAVLFKASDVIFEYEGDIISQQELDRRYRDKTAPYAGDLGDEKIDSACHRGVASLINHRPWKVSSEEADRGLKPSNAKWQLKRAYGDHPARLFVIAKKIIRNGEEISLSYGSNVYRFNEAGVSSRTR